MPVLVEPGKEIERRCFERALGAVELRVDDFLMQKLPQPFNQVQVGRIRRQKDLHQALVGQPLGQGLVL